MLSASMCWFICIPYKKKLQIGQAYERKKAESYKSNFVPTLYQLSHSLHMECLYMQRGSKGRRMMMWHTPSGVLERGFFTDLRKPFHYHSKLLQRFT